MKTFHITPRARIWASLLVVTVIATAATWTKATPGQSDVQTDKKSMAAQADHFMALLAVSNMSCGGCVDTITKALAPLPGVSEVAVDVARGTAQVYFDPEVLKDRQQMARAITEAGYPAQITRIDSAKTVREEALNAARRAKTHIASVGQMEIARNDYSLELGHVRKRYEQIYGQDVFSTEQGSNLLTRLKSQVALRLIDEGIKLQEVARAGFTVKKEAVAQAFSAYLRDRSTTLAQLKADLADNEYPFSYFQEKFNRKFRLQQYLEEKILQGTVDEDARQQQYGNWLANARLLANVTYYDKELEKLVKVSSAASCSGGGSGSCSRSK